MKLEDKIWYGGDYNPDQWPQEIWDMDMDYMKQAKMNIITLPVFSWARIQKDEDSFDLEWLKEIIHKAHENGIQICLATSTAVQPAWLSKKYPDILPVDQEGKKRHFGGRAKFCPNSDNYKRAAKKLVTKLAETFKDYPNILLWHIGNEYDNYCYCETCRQKFVAWVKDKYKTIEAVNERWYMQFWGHQLHDFDEIVLPDNLSETWEGDGMERTTFQCILLDYKRFMNDAILSCYLNEYEVIKAITPDIPVTTNLMGTFKPLDYFKWAKHMDIVSWDHYPGLRDEPYKSALRHDLMRSLKGGKPFMLMEQSPSQQNWAPYVNTKRPGDLRLQSYQTLAHGADAIMYFQIRRSRGNCEKFHGALIDHVGHTHTRSFRECQGIGEELHSFEGGFTQTRSHAKVGILFDWENWWAIEMSSGPSIDIRYMDTIEKYYEAIYRHHMEIDFVEMGGDFSSYDLLIAPMLYMVKEGVKEKIEAFVSKGGTFLTTTFSGFVDENDLVQLGGYPGDLRALTGIWIEEIDGLYPDATNQMVMDRTIQQLDKMKDVYSCSLLCDVIHLESATALASFGADYYKGLPVVTKNAFGQGEVYYIGTQPDKDFLSDFCGSLLEKMNLRPYVCVPEGVEITCRSNEKNDYVFLLNYSGEIKKFEIDFEGYDLVTKKEVKGCMTLEEKGVAILCRDKGIVI